MGGRQHRDVEWVADRTWKEAWSAVVACDETFGVSDGSYQHLWPDVEIPPGSKSRACTQGGPSGTWEVLLSPQRERGTAKRGNGARWDGREGVGVPHST